jgi:cytochrome c oxidase cbb3-type subunit 3
MSDFTSGFWDIYVSAITLVSIAACAVLLKSLSRRKVASDADKTGHVWDEDLEELNNPLPRWWIWLFYITIVFSLAYLWFYPGLGSFGGSSKWTSLGQYTQEMAKADEELAPLYDKFSGLSLAELAADPAAQALGQRLFLNYCAQCHASDGGGSKGFPNLTDRDWQYGGTPEAIEASILNGRTGVMPPFGAALGSEGTKDVAHYVRSLSGLTTDSIRVARGGPLFAQHCVACHGADGKGNAQLGAPNLTDRTWLHGSLEPVIIETIGKGRTSAMPAHKDFLGTDRVHVLAGFVYGLGNPEARKSNQAGAK